MVTEAGPVLIIDEKDWARCPACERAPVVQVLKAPIEDQGKVTAATLYIASCWGDFEKRGLAQFPSHSFVVRALSLEGLKALWNNR